MSCELPDTGTINKKIVVARKPYKCCECSKQIGIGDKYESFEACWPSVDGWDRFKTCLRCSNVREQAIAKYPPMFNDEHPAFGELFEYIRENRRQ